MGPAKHLALEWAEQGRIPEAVVRRGIRLLLKQRLASLPLDDCEAVASHERSFLSSMSASPVAPHPDKANEQHYELPPAFFEPVLGRHRKYSCCYWGRGVDRLDDAESQALEITCERAGVLDGMSILELGCGWGSLTLWMAQRYPRSSITAVSNSRAQGTYIRERARRLGLHNVLVLTVDMNDFTPEQRFDRVISVEMFEHMRNWQRLFERIHGWLVPGGQLFMHIFCHRSVPYEFEDHGASDWMARNFFTAGIMPSDGLPRRFQQHLRLCDQWRWSGLHYARTAEAWLANMDSARESLWPILAEAYGDGSAEVWWMRWRLFFMACAELFGYRRGQEWWVSHYLFERARG